MLLHEELTGKVIAGAVRVHSVVGPGLLESVYEVCLAHELAKNGVAVERHVPIAVHYEGEKLGAGFFADLIADRKVLIVVRAVERLAPIHEAQLMTYLRLSGIKVGLLFNFYQVRVMDNMIRRVM